MILLFRCLLNHGVQTALKEQWRRSQRNVRLRDEVGALA